jgi:hypothetical protein
MRLLSRQRVDINIIHSKGETVMKRLMVASILLLAGISGEVVAACSDPQVTGSDLTGLITGNTVCATSGGDQWQEQHRTGGQLWDYKKGSDPVDPTKQVGNWSIAADNVTYSYTGGQSYTYSVHGPTGGPYSFCSGGAEVVGGATFKTGSSSCP